MLFPIDGGRASRTAAREKAGGTRMREDWRPSPDDAAFAEKLGLSLEPTSERFRDFWLGKVGEKGRKADWSATWRNWCRKDAEEQGRRPAAGARPRTADTSAGEMLAEMRAARGSFLP